MAWWDDIGNAVQGAAQGAADSFGQFLQQQYGQSPEWIQAMMGQPAPPPEPVEPVEPPYGPGNFAWDEQYATPPWISTGDVGVGVRNQERMQGMEQTRAEAGRDDALRQGPYSESQRQYLADVPFSMTHRSDVAGFYQPWDGKVALASSMNPTTDPQTAQHELDHALYYNLLSPKERLQWTDAYNLAVMEGKMRPIREAWEYFKTDPGMRAVEMYPQRQDDLPYDMYRFYDPPTIPVSVWPEPVWRRQKRPFDPSRAR